MYVIHPYYVAIASLITITTMAVIAVQKWKAADKGQIQAFLSSLGLTHTLRNLGVLPFR
jgi:hypothetical protein